MSLDPRMPTDEPLGVVADDGQFRAGAHAQVHCFTCRREFPAGTIDASEVRRLEGVSDPADMLLVVEVTCPHCGASGSLTLNYGPESTVEDAEVLRDLDRRPSRPEPQH